MNRLFLAVIFVAANFTLPAIASADPGQGAMSLPPDSDLPSTEEATTSPEMCGTMYDVCRTERQDLLRASRECIEFVNNGCQSPQAAPVVASPSSCEQSCTRSGGSWDAVHHPGHPCGCARGRVLARDGCHCVVPRVRATAPPTPPPAPAPAAEEPAPAPAPPPSPTARDIRHEGFCPSTCAGQTTRDERDRDLDCDGVPDARDNCVSLCNPLQTDTDHDTVGAACDDDGVDRELREQVYAMSQTLVDLAESGAVDHARLADLASRLDRAATRDDVEALRRDIAALRRADTQFAASLDELRERYFSRFTFAAEVLVLPEHLTSGTLGGRLRLFQINRFGLDLAGGLGTDFDGNLAGTASVNALYLSRNIPDTSSWSFGLGLRYAGLSPRPFMNGEAGLLGGEVSYDTYFPTGDHDPMIAIGGSFGAGHLQHGDRSHGVMYGAVRIGITIW